MSAIEHSISISFKHRIWFTKNVFSLSNRLLKEIMAKSEGQQPKALVILDESLHLAQPALAPQIEIWFKTYAETCRLVCAPVILEGGERVKNSYFHVS
jgi:3-dehydroquinate synthase